MRSRNNTRGQSTVEMAVVFTLIVMPITLGLLMVAQATWTWSGVIHLTRKGAQYAATHCWQDSGGSNVITYMQSHLPPLVDSTQITSGPANITVQYWTQDAVNHQTIPFDCPSSCSADCSPDAVTVTVSGYQFRSLVKAVGLQPIAMPPYSTTIQVTGVGVDPDTGVANP